jgi:CspA family cold shock protein
MTGIIKSLIVEKNFGFITPDDGGKDIFFHASALSGGLQFADLQKGQKVSFDVEDSEKGPRAANVVLVA